ncbi:fructose-6-phosphate aldolase [Desulfurispirillum indicum]|uniref:Probable transaldolase n=1 Tax=Desulfurispirillum indicum (strain ATCC BAA-1389 / DSM 22839 / S5) TaxID=653733 RepID=E6W2A2_DESIS|nr:fructose-6-phosphate aldolase [Desulfurispirillum indicum]ADU65560.1 transaldolase [Desulfurispirillum indicum S5]UCZ57608.1 fructose-6-phosphate aldolase [Desulfurispirillum indicum]
MKFFIDTANLQEITQASAWGLIDGVTTNPSLLAKEGKQDSRELFRDICALVDGPVSAEVIALDAKGMLREARELAKIADNIVIKLPLTLEGLQATKALCSEGIMTNVTLCFSANQALLAAKAGATYISPFVGRLDDIAAGGLELVSQIRTIYDNYDFATQIIVASVRSPLHVLDSALIGADIATIPFKVLSQLVQHPLTDRGIDAFLADWQKTNQ